MSSARRPGLRISQRRPLRLQAGRLRCANLDSQVRLGPRLLALPVGPARLPFRVALAPPRTLTTLRPQIPRTLFLLAPYMGTVLRCGVLLQRAPVPRPAARRPLYC